MASYPYDIKLTIGAGAHAGTYGFMLVTPPQQTKQLAIAEVPMPPMGRLLSGQSWQDNAPEFDTPVPLIHWEGGMGTVMFDEDSGKDSYWWGNGVVSHVDGKVYLAPPLKTPLNVGSSTTQLAGMYSYITGAGVQYDFAWTDKYLYRRTGADSTTAWTLVYTEENSQPITDFKVFNGVGLIATPTETDANSTDFWIQTDPTAAATWTPTAKNHTPFTNANGRPKFFIPQRGTCYAAVDNGKVFYTVDPTLDTWLGPISLTIGAATSPGVGELTYPFNNVIAVNDYLLCFRPDAGLSVDSQQNITEVFWEWKSKPSFSNFKYVAACQDQLLLTVSPEVYVYDPGAGDTTPMGLSKQAGFSVQEILGIDADNQYAYILARVQVPTLRSAPSIALIRAISKPGRNWDFECLWEDTSVGTKVYGPLRAFSNGVGTRVYFGYQASSNAQLETQMIEIPADWDETDSGSFATSGVLYSGIAYSRFPTFMKRFLVAKVMTERTVSSTYKIAVAYSIDNGISFSTLGDTGAGDSGSVTTEFTYPPGSYSRSVVVRFTLTSDGADTPVMRQYIHHQRPRVKYLQQVHASIRVGNGIESLNGVSAQSTVESLKNALEYIREEDGSILYEDYLGNSIYVSAEGLQYKPSRHENPTDKGELEAQIVFSRADGGY